MRIVILISADDEWRVLKSLLKISDAKQMALGEYFEFFVAGLPVTLLHGGWGKVSAAASAQYVIDTMHPDLLINLGTCGGFEGRIERGSIILVERTVIYDIVEQMTDAAEAIEHYSASIDNSWVPESLLPQVVQGLLVSGDRDILVQDIPELVQKFDAVAADWESGSIAWVALRNHQRVLILRGVSDLVGGQGGEAYGDYELFLRRTRQIMQGLFDMLPAWLTAFVASTAGTNSAAGDRARPSAARMMKRGFDR